VTVQDHRAGTPSPPFLPAVASGSPSGPGSAFPPTADPGPTSPVGGLWGPAVERWRSDVSVWFRGGDVDVALAVILCASGGEPQHVSAHETDLGPAWGLFGFLEGLWPIFATRAREAGYGNGLEVDSPADQLAVAAYLVYETPRGWSHFVRDVT